MSVRPVKALPISYFRSHTRACLAEVTRNHQHILLTRHGKAHAAVIPMYDIKSLWQLQDRPVKEMEQRLKDGYARWLKAKQRHEEGWDGMELGERAWVPYWHFQKM